MLARLTRSASFVLGLLCGVGLYAAVQWVMPGWEIKVLHTQEKERSFHTVIRASAYTGQVEQLFTTEPK